MVAYIEAQLGCLNSIHVENIIKKIDDGISTHVRLVLERREAQQDISPSVMAMMVMKWVLSSVHVSIAKPAFFPDSRLRTVDCTAPSSENMLFFSSFTLLWLRCVYVRLFTFSHTVSPGYP